MITFDGPPSRWIVHGGKPASITGDCTKGRGGMPSYENTENGMVVMDLLVAMPTSNGGMKLLSRFYGVACLISPECEGVPLHHDPAAWWDWRPLLYRRALFGWDCLGSQEELSWRYGLHQMQLAMDAIDNGEYDLNRDFKMMEADEKARKLLRENTTDQQRLELAASGGCRFKCRGGKTKNLYEICIGNGFKLISKLTHESVASFCWHTEYWIPHEDVALATKLQLEDPELEEEVLTYAQVSFGDGPHLRADDWDRRAREMEAELI